MPTNVDPKAVDRQLAEISARRWEIIDLIGRTYSSIHYAVDDVRDRRSGWRLTDSEAEAKLIALREDPKNFRARESAKNLTSLENLRTKLAAATQEFDTAEEPYYLAPWSRFYIVQDGHIHANQHCHSLRPTTRLGWLPELSGDTEETAVAAHGPLLCTFCFPTAPVEWTAGIAKAEDPTMCDNKVRGEWYTRGRYAHCTVCGAIAATTSLGNLRKHKRPTE